MGPNTPKVLLAVNVMALIAVTMVIGLRIHFNRLSSHKMKREPGIRYILMYNGWKWIHLHSSTFFGIGRDMFVRKGCPHANCFVVHDRFSLPLVQYDAIVFYGVDLDKLSLPKRRGKKQKYIYFNKESADNFPVCNEIFDNFFDLTVSYRLDSDITAANLHVVDTKGGVVAPAKKVHWLAAIKSYQQFTSSALASKKRAAAWMVSHCDTNSKRDQVATNLQNALLSLSDTPERATIDVYGPCGTLNCSKAHQHLCLELLRKKYFFYLSFENSLSEDYVTEKVLNAVQSDLIPIVYGGADYSRFLPPGSYLDARQYSPRQLAQQMLRIMDNLTLLNSYFSWRSRYKIEPLSFNVCKVCAAVNDRHSKRHKSFRKWWHPQFKSYCPKKVHGHRKWWLTQYSRPGKVHKPYQLENKKGHPRKLKLTTS